MPLDPDLNLGLAHSGLGYPRVENMELRFPLVHVDEIRPRAQSADDGWAITEFRVPLSGADGSGTAAYHSIFRPGSNHAKHVHHNSDEVTIYLSGHGVLGVEGDTADVRPGLYRPRGASRRLRRGRRRQILDD